MKIRIAKLLLPVAAIAAVLAALPLAQAGSTRNHAVNSSTIAHDVQSNGTTTIGAGILRDKSNGEGALITRTTSTSNPSTLALRFKSYFPSGSQRGRGTVDISVTPAGQITFTGDANYTGGTGRFRGVTGRVTFDGAIDAEGTLTATIKGNARY